MKTPFYILFLAAAFSAWPLHAGPESASLSEHEAAPITVWGKRSPRPAPSEPAEFAGEVLPVEEATAPTLSAILLSSAAVSGRDAGAEGFPSGFLIRGQDPQQSRYFLEGVPLTDAEFNSAQIAFLPLESISQVDLYAQGVPLFLAEDGLGGAVQFKLEPLGRTGTQFRARAGSFGMLGVMGKARGVTPLPYQITADYQQSSEDFVYYDDRGMPLVPGQGVYSQRAHNQYRRISLLPQLSLYRSGTSEWRFFSLGTYAATAVPGPIQIPTPGDLQQWYQLAAFQHEAIWGSDVHSASTLYGRFDGENLRSQSGGLTPLPAGSSQAWAVGLRSHWRWDLGGGDHVEGIFGGNWESYRAHFDGEPAPNLGKTRWQIPFGVGAKWNTGTPLVVSPAAMGTGFFYQLTDSPYSGTPFSAPQAQRSFFLVSPRVGLEASLSSHWQWRGSVGSYFRAPSMAELYGAPGGIAPSQSLTYERAEKADIGVDFSFPHPFAPLRSFKASLTYAVGRAHDLIAYVQNSQQTRTATNVGESLVQSEEISLEARTEWDVSLVIAFSLLPTKNLSAIPYQNGRALPGRPDYRLRTTVGYEHGPWNLYYTFSLWGPSYWDLANYRRLSSTADHTVVVSWDAKSWGSFGLELRNLTDELTATSTFGAWQMTDNTTGYLGYPAPGRRIYLTWKITI